MKHFKTLGWSFLKMKPGVLLCSSPEEKPGEIAVVHTILRALDSRPVAGITDIVAAYNSLAVFYDDRIDELKLIRELEALPLDDAAENTGECTHIPVCFEYGLDWESVTAAAGMPKEEYIKRFLETEFIVAMNGFIPGFLYLHGLPKELACARREQPRTKIPAGTVAIGGEQAGIYGLESPGGWNSIGVSPAPFFSKDAIPPTPYAVGSKIRFRKVGKK